MGYFILNIYYSLGHYGIRWVTIGHDLTIIQIMSHPLLIFYQFQTVL